MKLVDDLLDRVFAGGGKTFLEDIAEKARREIVAKRTEQTQRILQEYPWLYAVRHSWQFGHTIIRVGNVSLGNPAWEKLGGILRSSAKDSPSGFYTLLCHFGNQEFSEVVEAEDLAKLSSCSWAEVVLQQKRPHLLQDIVVVFPAGVDKDHPASLDPRVTELYEVYHGKREGVMGNLLLKSTLPELPAAH